MDPAVAPLVDVLVVNSQNWLGLSRLPGTLARGGCRVTVLGPPGGTISRSRLVEHHVPTSTGVQTVVEALRRHLEEHPHRYRWVIFGDEPSLAEAAARRTEPWVRPWLPVSPDTDALDIILSKAPFAEACQKTGIPFPRTHLCHNWDEVAAAAEAIGFPLILKNPYGNGGFGVRKVSDLAALRQAYEPWKDVQPLLVQQLMQGRLGACEMLYDHGQLVCWFASYIMQCWPDTFGPSTTRQVMTHPEMEPLLRRLGEILGYHGLCGIDWFHDPVDDSLVVLEFNARPTTCYHLGRFAGVDFAQSIRAMLTGSRLEQRPQVAPGAGPTVYLFPQHIFRCLGAPDLRGLLHWVPGMDCHDVPWNEPRMLLRHCLRIGRLSLLYGLQKVTGRKLALSE